MVRVRVRVRSCAVRPDWRPPLSGRGCSRGALGPAFDSGGRFGGRAFDPSGRALQSTLHILHEASTSSPSR